MQAVNEAAHAASERTKLACLVTLVGVGVLLAAYDGFTYWYGFEATESLRGLASFIFIVLLVMWVDEDSRAQPSVYRPFDYGFLALYFWFPYLPYYFWRTRRAKGLLMLAGLCALLCLGWLIQLAIYFFLQR